MRFEYPELFLLLVFVVLVYRWVRVEGYGFLNGVRLLVLVLVVLCLVGPYVDMEGEGIDVLVLVDRSASVAGESVRDRDELLRLVGFSGGRGESDRVGVIGFGEGALVEARPTVERVSSVVERGLGAHGSDLSGALLLASAVRSPLRRTRLLVLSDGRYTGKDPLAPDVIGALAGMQVWYRDIGRPGTGDAAAEEIRLPAEVPAGAAFIIRFSIYSENDAEGTYALKKGGTKSTDGQAIAGGKVVLKKGSNVFFVRDRVDRGGIVKYGLEVSTESDGIPGNNGCAALMRVVAPPKVLLVSGVKTKGLIEKSLVKANIPVDKKLPGEVEWSSARLQPYKVVILENVSMKQLGFRGAQSLAGAVDSGICSLIVTGGEYAFGNGGYHKSPLDPLLPVSMEIKQEQRRGMMAVAAVLDRSGSMAAPVLGGGTKMDLANRGVAEAIRLLSPMDQVAVIAVDSQAHTILPLAVADDTTKLESAVLRIQSMGGGIFVRTAVGAAAKEIRKSGLTNRHIILFADAADSEEKKDTAAFVKKLVKEGITTSVIGLGSPQDVDADFLREVAEAGKGDIYFTQYPEELPRLFSMEIIRVARRGFIREMTPVTVLPDMVRLQVGTGSSRPGLSVKGFNLSSLRRGASCAMKTVDEYDSPLVSFWHRGKTRTAAITAEIDGEYSGDLATWSKTPEMVVNLVRWAARGVNTADAKAYAAVSRGNAGVRVEFDETAADRLRVGELNVKFLPPSGDRILEAPLKWESGTAVYGEVALKELGHYLPVIDLGKDGIIKAPAISMHYSPEFLPETGISGSEVLASLARVTGGKSLVKTDEIFSAKGLRAVGGKQDLRVWFILLLFVLVLLEIAEKRLALSELVFNWIKR